MTPEQFREWRLRMGLTQAEAAELLGKSRRWVQMVEGGHLPATRILDLACAAIERDLAESDPRNGGRRMR